MSEAGNNSTQQAIDYLLQRLQEGAWPHGQRLPTIARMSKELGVCKTVCHRHWHLALNKIKSHLENRLI
jgi:DNA-binding GntR family transcriptional regulator